MTNHRHVAGSVAFVLLLAVAVAAQFPRKGPPPLSGTWNPEVGSGAVYRVESQGQPPLEYTVAVVGAESGGHWLEMRMTDPRMGRMIVKHLMVMQGNELQAVKVVMQSGDQPAMEMPAQWMGGQGRREAQKADIRKAAEHVGTETITTPAGTFTCEHYRTNQGTTDFWISEKVIPYGVVEMTSADGAKLTLVRLLTNQKSQIKGPVQKFDPSQMMRRPPR